MLKMLNLLTKIVVYSNVLQKAVYARTLNMGNLIRHLAVADHRYRREKTTLLDTAKTLYHRKLTTAENKKIIALSLDHTTLDSNDFERLSQLNLGWGLPKQNPPVRFTIIQKRFLDVSVPLF